jgi:hypothetical protein
MKLLLHIDPFDNGIGWTWSKLWECGPWQRWWEQMNHQCMMNLHTVYDEPSDMLHRGSFILTRELGEVKHLKPHRERNLVISRRVWCLIHVDLLLRFQSKFFRKCLCYWSAKSNCARSAEWQPMVLWRLFLKGVLLLNRQSYQLSRCRIML